MSIILNRVCPGLFLDSVVLMQISRSIASLEGVEDSALMIGTPSNLDLLDNAGLLKDTSRQAAGGDLPGPVPIPGCSWIPPGVVGVSSEVAPAPWTGGA